MWGSCGDGGQADGLPRLLLTAEGRGGQFSVYRGPARCASGKLCSKHQQRPKEKRILFYERLCPRRKAGSTRWATERTDLQSGLALNDGPPHTFLISLKSWCFLVSVPHFPFFTFSHCKAVLSVLHHLKIRTLFIHHTEGQTPFGRAVHLAPPSHLSGPGRTRAHTCVGHLTSQPRDSSCSHGAKTSSFLQLTGFLHFL